MPSLINLTIYHLSFLKVIAAQNGPITGKETRARLVSVPRLKGISERVSVRQVIRDLRKNKMPICEKRGGYYYARDPYVLRNFIKKFEVGNTDGAVVFGLKGSEHNTGFPKPEDFTLMCDFPIRKDDATVALRSLEVDVTGKPIVPVGVELMQ